MCVCFRLAQWIKDTAEKKKEAEEEKAVRRERRRAGPKHIFTDHEYMNQIQANAENIDDALKQGEENKTLCTLPMCLVTIGLAACSSSSSSSNATSGTKRPSTEPPAVKSKKIHLW